MKAWLRFTSRWCYLQRPQERKVMRPWVWPRTKHYSPLSTGCRQFLSFELRKHLKCTPSCLLCSSDPECTTQRDKCLLAFNAPLFCLTGINNTQFLWWASVTRLVSQVPRLIWCQNRKGKAVLQMESSLGEQIFPQGFALAPIRD